MAKKSMIAKNEQRKVIVARYAAKRLELKKALVDPASTDEQREAARLGLQKLPRNASPVRVRGRDSIDGRPRGFLSEFGVSRVRFRDMAHRANCPELPSQAGKFELNVRLTTASLHTFNCQPIDIPGHSHEWSGLNCRA